MSHTGGLPPPWTPPTGASSAVGLTDGSTAYLDPPSKFLRRTGGACWGIPRGRQPPLVRPPVPEAPNGEVQSAVAPPGVRCESPSLRPAHARRSLAPLRRPLSWRLRCAPDAPGECCQCSCQRTGAAGFLWVGGRFAAPSRRGG
eukprot:12887589-Alexandrium_andersonii.AAC.1